MELWRVPLTVIGGVLGVAAIVAAAIQTARSRLKTQRIEALTSFEGAYDVVVHGEDSPQGQAQLERQRRYEEETGHLWGTPEPRLKLVDVVRGEFTVPAALGVASVVISTVAGSLPS